LKGRIDGAEDGIDLVAEFEDEFVVAAVTAVTAVTVATAAAPDPDRTESHAFLIAILGISVSDARDRPVAGLVR